VVRGRFCRKDSAGDVFFNGQTCAIFVLTTGLLADFISCLLRPQILGHSNPADHQLDVNKKISPPESFLQTFPLTTNSTSIPQVPPFRGLPAFNFNSIKEYRRENYSINSSSYHPTTNSTSILHFPPSRGLLAFNSIVSPTF